MTQTEIFMHEITITVYVYYVFRVFYTLLLSQYRSHISYCKAYANNQQFCKNLLQVKAVKTVTAKFIIMMMI